MAPPRSSQTLSSMTVSDLRNIIREEINNAIKSQVEKRLDSLEESIKQMTEIRSTVSAMEDSLNFTSSRLDDLHKVTLPALAKHVESISTALVFQTLDLDVHRRKWSLTIQGLTGNAGEPEDATRRACVNLAQEHLGVTNAKDDDLAACHRLKQEANAGVIIRFRDLQDRNRWLDGARNLKGGGLRISIGPDLPPVLRQLKTELLNIRKSLPKEQKSRSNIRYLAQWPYVELTTAGNSKRVRPSITKEAIAESVLKVKPFLTLTEPTD